MSLTALKAWTKPHLQALPSSHPAIVIASMGRSGSTFLFDTVRKSMAADRFPLLPGLGLKIVSDVAWELGEADLLPGIVYKTHDLAQSMPQGKTGAKVIFVFGPASDAALSVVSCRDRFGEDWIEQHFEHLHATGRFDELLSKDVLRFGEQIDGWLGLSGVPRALIHYDAIWDHAEDLEAFCGLPLEFPARRPRRGAAEVPDAVKTKVSKTYAALDTRIAKLPRFQVLQ